MHVDRASRHYTAADGSERVYRRDLLRRSYRDEQGRPQKETLANLSALPDAAVVALRKVLSGAVLVEPAETFEIERSLSHGAVAAVHAMGVRLGVKKLLGEDCPERDLAYALVISRVLHPKSKLSTLGWWNDTTLGADLAVADASTDDVYAAMDWLGERQEAIEAALAKRHLINGGTAMFDLSSSWLEGRCCELGAFGYSRDKKRGLKQIEYGLLTDDAGRPIAVKVFPGNTSDTKSFIDAVELVTDRFGLTELDHGRRPWNDHERADRRRSARAPAWTGSQHSARPRSPPWPTTTDRCRCRCSTPRTSPKSCTPTIPVND